MKLIVSANRLKVSDNEQGLKQLGLEKPKTLIKHPNTKVQKQL